MYKRQDDEIDLKDKILFIEEIGEAPYKLHRILWQLKLAGKLEDLSGIMIGDIDVYKRQVMDRAEKQHRLVNKKRNQNMPALMVPSKNT